MDRARAPIRAGGAWALASVAVVLIVGLVRTIISARYLAPAEIGLVGIALLALGFIEAVASTGIDSALVATRDDVDAYMDPAFTVQVVRGLLVFGLLCAAAPGIAWMFGAEGATAVIRSVAVIALLRGLANPAVALAIRQLDFRRVFWWGLPELLCSLGLTIVLVIVRGDVWALVIALLAAQVVATIASYGLVPRRPMFTLARERIQQLLKFGRFVSASRALMYCSVNLDAAVVGVGMGTHSLGLYQFAARVAELPVTTFTRAAAQVALPALSGLRESPAVLLRTFRTMLAGVFAVNCAAAMFVIFLGEMAVEAVAGPRWLAAVPVLKILAIAMPFRAVVVLTGQLLDAIGQPAATMQLNAVRLVSLLVLLPSLGEWGGAQGVAQGVLLANAGAALFSLRLSTRMVPL